MTSASGPRDAGLDLTFGIPNFYDGQGGSVSTWCCG
jgi:hypothetical protein